MNEKEKWKLRNQKVNEKFDRITILVPKGKKEEYRKEAKLRGINLTNFFVGCAEEFLQR